MKCTIVVVSWNTKRLLESCLASIYQHPPVCLFEVIVVDNASTDGSAALVQNHFPQATLIANKENVGFAQANNQAIAASQGKYVLLLNPDTEVEPQAFSQLISFMDNNGRSGAVGAYLLNSDRTLQTSSYPFPTLGRELWRLLHLDTLWTYGVYKMANWDPTQVRQVDVLKGACLLLRRQALAQVGVLDEGYFMYTEEVDLCYRLHQAGWQRHWVPQAKVVHHEAQSTRQVKTDMFLQLYRSKLRYFRKHYGRFAGWAYKLTLLISALPRLIGSPLISLIQPLQRRQYLALANRYWKLLLALPSL